MSLDLANYSKKLHALYGEHYDEMLATLSEEMEGITEDIVARLSDIEIHGSEQGCLDVRRLLHRAKGITSQNQLDEIAEILESIETVMDSVAEENAEFKMGTAQVLTALIHGIEDAVKKVSRKEVGESAKVICDDIHFHFHAFKQLYHQQESGLGLSIDETLRKRIVRLFEINVGAKSLMVSHEADERIYAVKSRELDRMAYGLGRALVHVPELDQHPQVSTVLDEVNRTLWSLQEIRSVTLWSLSRQLQRSIEKCADDLSKPVLLDFIGFDSEIDIGWYQLLGDALQQLCCFTLHFGVESRQQRLERDGQGLELVLRFKRFGDRCTVVVEDNGGGIDPERLGAWAVEKRLLSAQECHQLSAYEKQCLIFMPDFSRHMGDGQLSALSQIKSSIESRGGTLFLDSDGVHGTTFTIAFPNHYYQEKVLVVCIGSDKFAVPVSVVSGVVKGEKARIEFGGLVDESGEMFPLLYLRTLPVRRLRADFSTFVLLHLSGTPCCLQVSSLVGEFDLPFQSVNDSRMACDLISAFSNTSQAGRVSKLNFLKIESQLNQFLYSEDELDPTDVEGDDPCDRKLA